MQMTNILGKLPKECYMINFGTYLKDIFGIRKYIHNKTKIPERIKITPNTIYVSGAWIKIP